MLETLTTQKRLVLTAPTGSGKSTQVPQMLLDGGLLGDGQVTVLQPRRLPTRMLAAWVAQASRRETRRRGRLSDAARQCHLAATRICYVTEGVLLRRMLADPDLTGVSAIVFDEFHERHLYGDITLARALQIQESTRPDLIIVVMSATLDVATVEKYLQPCAVLSSEGAHLSGRHRISRPNLPVTRRSGNLRFRELQRLGARASARRRARFHARRVRDRAAPCRRARDALGPQFVVFPLHGELPPQRSGRGGGPATTGAKSSSPPTSRKPRSPSTACAW